MGDGNGERYARRRTAFENDLRELIIKIVLGFGVGVGLKVLTGWEAWFIPVLIGIVAVFMLANAIRGDGNHGD